MIFVFFINYPIVEDRISKPATIVKRFLEKIFKNPLKKTA